MTSTDYLPDHVGDSEKLIRFIIDSQHYKSSDMSIMPMAFMPANGETSVLRNRGLSKRHIYKKANDNWPGKWLGRAVITAIVCRDSQLDVESKKTNNMGDNHAIIIGWPENKAIQLSIAQSLAISANRMLPK